jgi:hypothetical protein
LIRTREIGHLVDDLPADEDGDIGRVGVTYAHGRLVLAEQHAKAVEPASG